MRMGDRRRATLALGASALVHGLAAAIVLKQHRSNGPATEPRLDRFELALVDRPAPAPDLHEQHPRESRTSPPDLPPPAWGGGPATRKRSPGQRPLSPASPPSPGPAAERVPDRPPVPPPERPAPGSTAWLEAEGLAPGEAVPPVIHLGPVHGPRADDDGEADAEPGVDGRKVQAEKAHIKARLDGWLNDLLAADRARNLPDVYWMRLREHLEDGFRVGWEVLRRGSPEDALMSGSRVGQALIAWQHEAEQWARGGQRLGPGSGSAEASEAEAEMRRLDGRGLLDHGGRAELLLTELVTRVEIEQGSDGSLLTIALVAGSGNGALDQLVLERVGDLVDELRAALGPPPEEGRRTRWAVRTRFEMFPPVPLVGCSFDAYFRPAGCFYPLKRTVKTSVALERVWAG
ncbi:MAG TPA: hypothetical protein VFG59_13355 [Anaeromyxobacter sp.]|nr:hypothetical protein [Anaeromyxobacter sp.]